jgi:hypothetical protein
MQENYLHKLTIFSRYFVTLFVSFSRAIKIQLPIKHYHLSRRCVFIQPPLSDGQRLSKSSSRFSLLFDTRSQIHQHNRFVGAEDSD